ncbi:MAG: hypothetical protein AAF740_05510 [Bacteroidota bacterium]
MEEYIKQLVEDLTTMAKTPLECPDYKLLYPNHPAIKAGLDYILAWEVAPDIPMTEAFDLLPETFPHPEQLKETQATRLNQAIINLWEANRIFVSVPERVPSQLIVYRELRDLWQTGTIRLLPNGNTTLGFCSYEAETCPWGEEFCTCKDEDWYNEDVDMDNYEKDGGELPF